MIKRCFLRPFFASILTLALLTPLGPSLEAFAQPAGEAPAEAPLETTVVFLVRHGEKTQDHPHDPSLSHEGLLRAAALADLLADAGIDHIFSSDFIRTRRTVQPLADRLRLSIQPYDPGDLPALAQILRAQPGRHLVSGHSNTTPQLVALLGGEPGEPIDEATEYDRLYILTLAPSGTVTTLLRYGP
jgi:broad specificity phosphatase PhoE